MIVTAFLVLCNLSTILAADATVVDSGYCGSQGDGSGLTWAFYADGKLFISGRGDMADYDGAGRVPWHTDQTQIKSVAIGADVTSVGDYAFDGCSAVTNLVIPDKVTKVGESAFANCDSLTEISIPDQVKHVGNYAFYSCDKLASVTIGTNVQYIGKESFRNCDALTSIGVKAGNTAYSSVDGVLFDRNGTTLLQVPEGLSGSYAVPVGVGNIGKRAFYSCEYLTVIAISDRVKSIGNEAFTHCSALTTIHIGSNVESIGQDAFHYCPSLDNIYVDAGNICYSDVDGVLFSKSGTALVRYPEGKTSTVYDIPVNVTEIRSCAFFKAAALTEVLLPDSVSKIGTQAFAFCKALKKVTFGSGVNTIEDNAFYGCWSMGVMDFLGNEPENIGTDAFVQNGYPYITTVNCHAGAEGWPSGGTWNGYVLNTVGEAYSVTVGSVVNGSVSVSASTAAPGTVLTVSTWAGTGFELARLLVNGAAISGNTFIMPARDVVVTAVFAADWGQWDDFESYAPEAFDKNVAEAAGYRWLQDSSTSPAAAVVKDGSNQYLTVNSGRLYLLPGTPASSYSLEFDLLRPTSANGQTMDLWLGNCDAGSLRVRVRNSDSKIAVTTDGGITNYFLQNDGNAVLVQDGSARGVVTAGNDWWHIKVVVDQTAGSVTLSANLRGSDVVYTGTLNVGTITYSALRFDFHVGNKHHSIDNLSFDPLYSISVGQCTNGSLRVDKSLAKAGECVAIGTIPVQGYKVDKIMVDGTAVQGDTITVTGDHTVSATFNELGSLTDDFSGYQLTGSSEGNPAFDYASVISKGYVGWTGAGKYAVTEVGGNRCLNVTSGRCYLKLSKPTSSYSLEFDLLRPTINGDNDIFDIWLGTVNETVFRMRIRKSDSLVGIFDGAGTYYLQKDGTTSLVKAGTKNAVAVGGENWWHIKVEVDKPAGLVTLSVNERGSSTVYTGSVVLEDISFTNQDVRLDLNNTTSHSVDNIVFQELSNTVHTVDLITPVSGGTLRADSSFGLPGDKVTVTAIPENGYVLDRILVDGEPIVGKTFAITGDHWVTASFKEIKYSVQTVCAENGVISVDETGRALGDKVTVTAIPRLGYSLSRILVDGAQIQGNAFTITGDHTVTAEFVQDSEAVNLSGCVIDLKSSLALAVQLSNLTADDGYTYTVSHKGTVTDRGAPEQSDTNTLSYQMSFDGIAAKEMRDIITFTLYKGVPRYMFWIPAFMRLSRGGMKIPKTQITKPT